MVTEIGLLKKTLFLILSTRSDVGKTVYSCFHHFTPPTKYPPICDETCPPVNGIVSLVLSRLDFCNAALIGIPAYLLRRLQ